VVAKATLAMALMCTIYGHPVDALVDVVGGLESGRMARQPVLGCIREKKRRGR
jgi:hypothetical protein